MSAQTKKKLSLTSRAKSRHAKKPVTTTNLGDLKAALAASVEQVTSGVPGLDGDAAVDQQTVGELVAPVQIKTRQIRVTGKDGKQRLAKAARSQTRRTTRAVVKVEKAEPAAEYSTSDELFKLLSRPERCTVREMMSTLTLTHAALKNAVSKLLRERNLRIVLQRNPQPDPEDRALTAYLYAVEKA